MLFLELDGAADRVRRDRENVWFGAMLPHLEKPIELRAFMGEKPDPRARAKRFHEVWDRIDRALAQSAGP
ncbi:hypothetical protein [Paracoccus laeviglucosivorans]|uniref:hypothetical protein n=1 Tax=Paracoccus laeviglucosivorans TaxID=1197861 RepID=UPI001159D418|nr:hypothetical protein [Paracoccus laeviglucosivorans]